jgi:hypothetical protein
MGGEDFGPLEHTNTNLAPSAFGSKAMHACSRATRFAWTSSFLSSALDHILCIYKRKPFPLCAWLETSIYTSGPGLSSAIDSTAGGGGRRRDEAVSHGTEAAAWGNGGQDSGGRPAIHDISREAQADPEGAPLLLASSSSSLFRASLLSSAVLRPQFHFLFFCGNQMSYIPPALTRTSLRNKEIKHKFLKTSALYIFLVRPSMARHE